MQQPRANAAAIRFPSSVGSTRSGFMPLVQHVGPVQELVTEDSVQDRAQEEESRPNVQGLLPDSVLQDPPELGYLRVVVAFEWGRERVARSSGVRCPEAADRDQNQADRQKPGGESETIVRARLPAHGEAHPI